LRDLVIVVPQEGHVQSKDVRQIGPTASLMATTESTSPAWLSGDVGDEFAQAMGHD
jgi:hypothetical protein